MRITIAERLKPYSHNPGTFFVLPGSNLRLQIFPTSIRLHDLSESIPKMLAEISINIQGPVQDFTIEQDLEKGCIRVWGTTATGYMRYSIHALPITPYQCSITIEREPTKKLEFSSSKHIHLLNESPKYVALKTERLSLGNNKAQDWVMMQRRCDMDEIFPHWFRLGQLTPAEISTDIQSGSLINECHNAISQSDRINILPAFRNLYLACFDLGLSPRLLDESYQGLPLPILASGEKRSPLYLLSQGAQLIRSLFFQQNNNVLNILPALPPEFHCGRMLHIACETSGECDIEWSKKIIRRMIFRAAKNESIQFCFPKTKQRFRLRTNENECGTVIDCGTMLDFEQGQTYLFDHFE